MINIKDYLEAVNYRVTSGDKFYWDVYPNPCFVMDYDEKWCSCSVVYDSNKTVYEVNATDTAKNVWYRWIMPEFVAQTVKEEQAFGCDPSNYVLLDVEQDIMQKLTAIAANKPYDERVIVPCDISDNTFLALARAAHEKDVTFNTYITELLIQYINASKVKCPA